jgi:glycosyltransferase involved in cell wall biosynthesis
MAVFSTSPPLSAHLAALQLKRNLGVPWIADFRDPLHPSDERPASRLQVHSMLQSLLFERADAIIANTDVVGEQWGARYPRHREKLHVIWNGFDPEDVVSALPIPERPFKHLAHLGELYAGRHPGPILDSIQRLVAGGAVARGALRLSLIGTSSDAAIPNMDVLRSLVAAGIVEYVPTLIPRDAARLVARQADALVLLQPQSDSQVPAKLFEYIRVGRPVLAFIRRRSPVERILGRSGIPYRAIYPEDSPEQVDAKMLELLGLRHNPVSPSEWFVEQFDVRRQTQALSGIVNRLVRPAGEGRDRAGG